MMVEEVLVVVVLSLDRNDVVRIDLTLKEWRVELLPLSPCARNGMFSMQPRTEGGCIS